MVSETHSSAQPDDTGSLRQELRLAVIMTGGVSLAIWMGGVARELNLLLNQGEPASPQSQLIRRQYRALLAMAALDVSLDVLSGTSAGGINSAILGLANVNNADIGQLRKLWLEQGSFGRLLRDPNAATTPSLLKGDEQLLSGLRDGLQSIIAEGDAGQGSGAPDHGDRPPTDVFITTTLLDGQPSRFVDEYHTLVCDVDHHGLFHFDTERLTGKPAADRLALAARCSASFPVAFEPAHLTIGPDSDANHPDMNNLSNVTRSSYVADGGLLANRPIAAAVRAVFDRPAGSDVRRVLLYIVPTAKGAPAPASQVLPGLGSAVLKDLAAMTSQAITADLAGIRAHNESVQIRLDTYRQLAGMGQRVKDDLISDEMYGQYRSRASDSLASTLFDEALRQIDPVTIPLDDEPEPSTGEMPGAHQPIGDRTARMRADLAAAIADMLPNAAPAPGDYQALGKLGRRGYDAAKVITLALISRAYQAHPSLTQRQSLAAVRQAVHDALPPPPPTAMDIIDIVSTVASRDVTGAALGRQMVDEWASRQQTSEQLAEGWRRLAAEVAAALPLFRSLLGTPQPGKPGPGLDPVLAYIGNVPDVIASRMAQLHIAETALLPRTGAADQRLELIQVSADTATLLDGRKDASKKLTGFQLHHFGAFYKYAWRANDWMWGRLDGAGWLVHLLLDPERLRTLLHLDGDPVGYRKRLTRTLSAVASGDARSAPPGAEAGTQVPAEVQHELDDLLRPDGPPMTSLPETAKWVAAGIQRIILEEELPCVAEQIEADAAAGAGMNPAAEAFLSAMRDPSTNPASRLAACRVSDETFDQEMHSRLFQKTVKRTAIVTVKAVADSDKIPAPVKHAMRVIEVELRLIPAGLLVRSANFLRRLRPGRAA